MPKVSIILAANNSEEFISKTIDSVINQTFITINTNSNDLSLLSRESKTS